MSSTPRTSQTAEWMLIPICRERFLGGPIRKAKLKARVWYEFLSMQTMTLRRLPVGLLLPTGAPKLVFRRSSGQGFTAANKDCGTDGVAPPCWPHADERGNLQTITVRSPPPTRGASDANDSDDPADRGAGRGLRPLRSFRRVWRRPGHGCGSRPGGPGSDGDPGRSAHRRHGPSGSRQPGHHRTR